MSIFSSQITPKEATVGKEVQQNFKLQNEEERKWFLLNFDAPKLFLVLKLH